MQIALHIGAHSTDDDHLLNCLLKNRGALKQGGIVVPEPQRYRPVIRDTLKILRNDVATAETQEIILDAVLDEDDASRVVLSHEGFLGPAGNAVGQNLIYPHTSGKSARLRNLFSQYEVEFFLALRDPATFVPSVFERVSEPDFSAWSNGLDPMTLRWSDMLTRLKNAVPDAPVTVWCNEDTPLIWPEVLREIAGLDPTQTLIGQNDFLGTLMSKAGATRLEAYLEDRPPQNETQRRRIVAAFLDKFAKEEAIEQEIDLPGWTSAYVEQLTALYDEDVAQIAKLPGVRLIAP